jgi:hypothetical protein
LKFIVSVAGHGALFVACVSSDLTPEPHEPTFADAATAPLPDAGAALEATFDPLGALTLADAAVDARRGNEHAGHDHAAHHGPVGSEQPKSEEKIDSNSLDVPDHGGSEQ